MLGLIVRIILFFSLSFSLKFPDNIFLKYAYHQINHSSEYFKPSNKLPILREANKLIHNITNNLYEFNLATHNHGNSYDSKQSNRELRGQSSLIKSFNSAKKSIRKGMSVFIGDRTAFLQEQDQNVKENIRISLQNSDPENFLFRDLKISIFIGEVMLYGTVPNNFALVKSLEITRNVKGVHYIINHITNQELSKLSSVEKLKDVSLKSAVIGKLAIDRKTKAANYNISVVDGVVYIHGIAFSRKELQRTAKIAASTLGARHVISYIRNLQEEPEILQKFDHL